jgi:protein-L-isoaspartate(D-aspartate) O-methyltransferase
MTLKALIEGMDLGLIRCFYAEEVRIAAQVQSSRLVEAFAHVPREKYLGPGPWRIASAEIGMEIGMGGAAYMQTDDAHPRHVYHNVSIALDSARSLFNGQPATLARWMDVLDLKPGARVFHLGCGVGYYTAILAEAVGPEGSVLASEVDPDLAARSKANLAEYSNVEVQTGDGAALDPGSCDAMLINAGVTHPHPAWLERLRDGGRMVLPLTVAMGPSLGKGVMIMVTRQGDSFAARIITFVMIYSCTSVRDPRVEPLLGKAIGTGALLKMKSIRRDAHEQTDTCVLHGHDLCLSSV